MKRRHATSLASALVRRVFPVYLALAVILTLVQIGVEYRNTYSAVFDELDANTTVFETGVSDALWNFQEPLLQSIAKGMVTTGVITGVEIGDISRRIRVKYTRGDKPLDTQGISTRRELFHTHLGGVREAIGSITLYSNRVVVIERLKFGVILILIASVLKTAGLWLIIVFFVNRLLARPLERFTEQIRTFDFVRATEAPRFDIGVKAGAELVYLRDTFKELAQRALHSKRLATAKEAAEAASQAKTVFLAHMSHELRTPLNSILGFTQFLKSTEGLTSQQLAGLNTIEHSGKHLLTLINDILDVSKIEAGRFELSPRPTNLPALLSVVAEIIRIRAEEKSLAFVYEAADLPATVQVDDKLLRQVLLNLCSNAVKFTERGQITMRVKRLASKRPARARLRFEVQDMGGGIPAEQLETIFKPFEQAGEARYRTEGTGLGLTISREIVRLMGGDIHVESTVGHGSLFWFELVTPIIETELTEAPPERLPTGYRGPRKKVLVADDVAENRAALVELLDILGFAVIEAQDGEEALAQSEAHRPDLILMDVVMRGMDGIEAMRRMRADPVLRTLPVISISASTSNTDKQEALAAGANAFLAKPVDYQELLKVMGALLELTWAYDRPMDKVREKLATAPESIIADAPERDALVPDVPIPAEADSGKMPAPIPEALRAELERALVALDIDAVQAAIEALGKIDERFARILRPMAENFKYNRILEMVRSAGDRPLDEKSV